MSFDVVHVPGTPEPRLLSSATRAGGFIFLSGQGSVDLVAGKFIEDTFEGELRRTMENVQTVLRAAGADLSHVLRVGAYLRDESDLARYNELYLEYFKAPFPARTTVGNPFGYLKFELDCVAYVGDRGSGAHGG